ncbi:staphylococcal nuclease domain-containing protein 1 [Venturia canescens]|uniref:staphylococcal nuclease domain-containing protein 1 n=1 Tax=Venturia canescens TaxID=32260 RepID=UPI001C9C4F40|nr:staphylococcal nuclease domain-containing protein 1 [Venturia canescens]
MSTPQQQQQQQQQHVELKHGTVKLIVSGDTITIRGHPRPSGPAPEKTVCLSNITAPKLGRRGNSNADETRDEPWAWEAREFLRRKLISENVTFAEEKSVSASRTYGSVWIGKDANGENVAESLVSEGLATVKRDGVRNPSPALLRLQELEDAAKAAGKGKWSGEPSSDHIRDVKWSVENPRVIVDKYGGKPVKAIIEHVRDGSTVKALLLPDFYHITLMISGIRCPQIKSEGGWDEPFAKEAQYFVEWRLLQREVEVILESANNNNFVGSIRHPKGNIAELLLKEGFARCVDWSMNHIKSGVDKLYMAEKFAKEKRLRRWQDWVPSGPQVEYTGTVIEIASADSIIIRTLNLETKKIFLSSIRPPMREKKPSDDKNAPRSKDFRPLYDIPYMYEAREFLRKKLIRKQVKVVEDYIQPARDTYPEKVCCTVMVGKVNIAEAMVSKGLATVVRYRQNDDQRSSHYNELLAAENKAEKSQHGLHAKKQVPPQRIMDLSNDQIKAKYHMSALKRARGTKGVVEFVTSGSRLKLFLPKENCLITLLLAGVKAPRRSRPAPGGGGGIIEGEKYGEEAFAFMKEHTFQRDVEIQVETMESKGSGFIGWLFVDGVNMAVALVEEGLAEVSTFTENGEYLKLLKAAEERAKAQKLNIWKDRVQVEAETEQIEEEKEVTERKVDYREVVVSEITEALHFYAQYVDQRSMVEGLLARLRQELEANPPLPGAYNPKRGELVAAMFTGDDQWYRAKVEKISGSNVSVFYIDYGNREVLNVTRTAPLPAEFAGDKPYAHEHIIAFVELPEDNDDKRAAITALQEDLEDKTLLLNVEYKVNGIPAATLLDASTKDDLVKALVSEGYLLVEKRDRRSCAKLLSEYRAALQDAKKNHRLIWQYGDITGDDAVEFGVRK